MPRPRPELIVRDHDLAADAQARIMRDLKTIIDRGRHVARDGFPSSSMGGSGGGSDVSRPTETTAIAKPMHDPTGDDIRDLLGALADIYQASMRADMLRARIMAPVEQKGIRLADDPHCVNPNCGKSLLGEGPNDRGYGLRCNNCTKYRYTHNGWDRPRELCERDAERAERKRAAS